MPEQARCLLSAAGVPQFEHRARLLNREQLRWADLVLVMTAAHQKHVLELYPEFTRKVRLLREYAGFGEQDVEDPMGREHEAFARSMAAIREALEALIARGFSGA